VTDSKRDLAARLTDAFGGLALSHGIFVVEREAVAVFRTVQQLKNNFEFDLLLDVTAVDWPDREPRFDVVYHFYSTQHFARIRIKTRVPASDPTVDSLTPLYASAQFIERECHEMYGIGFRGNHDLRPLLLYEGFVGHPLRKDYSKEHAQPLVPFRS